MKTNAKNLEARFDAGEEVLDYFDTAHVTRWGGARRGAGRKPSGRKQYITRLSPELIKAIKARARLEKRLECEVVESLLSPVLK